ncbi:MAG: DUF2063 domain-containing protein [Alphaproteobacteria bacterium]|nr:DUF2063 domain-containing protein [Alphaproteobacteria bacterium]
MSPDAHFDEEIYSRLGAAILAREPARRLEGEEGDSLRVAAGVAVYRNNVRAAFLGVLEDAFPATRRLVGAEFFRFAAHEYFHARRPSSPLVARYGDAFPDFLESFEPARSLPYLPDVARIEIAWLSSYHAAEAQSLETEEIVARASVDPDRARFRLHPSAQFFSSRFPAHSIWIYNREERQDRLDLPETGEQGVFIRPDAAVLSYRLAPAPFAALKNLAASRPLGDALSAGLAAQPDAAPADILSELLSLPIVIGVQTPES